MKKLLAATLALVMVLSLFACTGPADDKTTVAGDDKTTVAGDDKTTAGATEGTTEAVDDSVYPIVKEGDDPITIKVVTITPDTTVGEERAIWKKIEEVTGIKIEWEYIDEEAKTTYMAQSDKDWPDLFHMSMSASLVNDYGEYGGRFVNYLEKLDIMPNLAKAFEDYPTAKKVVTLSNGEAYNVPYINKAVTNVASRMFVRTDLLEELGLEIPKTIEEFKNTLVKGKEKYGKAQWIYNGGFPAGNTTDSVFPIYGAFGSYTNMSFDVDENGKVVYAPVSNQMKLFYTFMNELFEEGLIHQEYKTIDAATKVDYEKSNCLYLYAASERMTTDDFADGKFHIGAVGALSSEYDNTLTLPGRISSANAAGFYINANSPYVDEICKLVDIAYATEEVVEGSGLYGISFTWGLEGVHWEYSGDSYKELTPESYKGSHNTFISQEVRHSSKGGRNDFYSSMVTLTPGNGQARQQAMVDNIWPYVQDEDDVFPIAQLVFTEDEQEVIGQYYTEINTYAGQMQTEFIQGISDIDAKWDEYVSNLEKMGLADVLAAYQAAYDRWMAK